MGYLLLLPFLIGITPDANPSTYTVVRLRLPNPQTEGTQPPPRLEFRAIEAEQINQPLPPTDQPEPKLSQAVPPDRQPELLPALIIRVEPSRGLLDGFWGEAEYLLWWQRGTPLPPLVTTSPPGTPRSSAGVLGQSGTQILFGNSREGEGPLNGGRFTLGYWWDPDETVGIQGSFFFLQNATFAFQDASDGSRILARPFFDANPAVNAAASQLVAFPGKFAGLVTAGGSSSLLGAEALLRWGLWGDWDPVSDRRAWRVDVVAGYRYLNLCENLNVHEDLSSIDPLNAPLVPGTRFQLRDLFGTTNDFHAGQLGIIGEIRRGPWSIQGNVKVGLGVNMETATIAGDTLVTVPGTPALLTSGGLLAQPTNIGHYFRDVFAVVPEVGISVAYQVTPRLQLSAGYTCIWWNHVARPGDQIDLVVNSTQLGGHLLTGPSRPLFAFGDSSYWVQGLTAGVRLNY